MNRPFERKRVPLQDEVFSRPYLIGSGVLLILCLVPWFDHRVSSPPGFSAGSLQSDARIYAVNSETLPLELESASLSVLGDAGARQVPLSGAAGVRIEIEKSGSEDWQVQWIPCTLDVPRNTQLVLSFEARAAQPRPMRVELSQDHEPWLPLGFTETVQLMEEWQAYEWSFDTPEEPDRGRICFHVGNGPSPEIRQLRLEMLPKTNEEPAKPPAPR